MKPSYQLPLKALRDVAIDAAVAAAQYIQGVDRSELQAQFKNAGSSSASQIVTSVDVRAEAIIRHHLQPSALEWNIAFVGEESVHTLPGRDQERFQKPYFWCVDPLDGTQPFVQGRPGYAVSIALLDRLGTPLIGVVYDPSHSTLSHAIRGQGADCDELLARNAKRSSSSLVVFADASFETHPRAAEAKAALKACAKEFELGEETFIYGSGAVKNACQVLGSEAACYLKLPKPTDGGGSVWDYAATACITSEAGGWVSNIFGQHLDLNREDSTFMNHHGVLYASNEKIARYLIAALS